MRPLSALMDQLVDYAGLFPPAELPLRVVTATYAAHRAGSCAWMLGRLIVPVSRLDELSALLSRTPLRSPWRVGALASVNELATIAARDGRFGPTVVVDTVELRADSVEAIAALAGQVPQWLDAYVEVPLEPDPVPLVEAIAAAGLRAKVRTGGVTPEAFPTASALARFLAACTRAGVPFKATAGLHHPVRGVYQLTYESGSARAPMFGFLNLLLAAAALRDGADEAEAVALLEECDPTRFTVGEHELRWAGRSWDGQALKRLRRDGLVAIGSCSFHEPVEELRSLYGAP